MTFKQKTTPAILKILLLTHKTNNTPGDNAIERLIKLFYLSLNLNYARRYFFSYFSILQDVFHDAFLLI